MTNEHCLCNSKIGSSLPKWSAGLDMFSHIVRVLSAGGGSLFGASSGGSLFAAGPSEASATLPADS